LYLSGFLVIRDFPLNFSLEVGEIWKNGDVVHVLLNGLVRDGVDQTRRAHGIRTGFSQSSKNSLNAQDYIPNSRLSVLNQVKAVAHLEYEQARAQKGVTVKNRQIYSFWVSMPAA
jgi:hypothetical protein